MDMTLDKAAQAIETFIKEGIVTAMNRFNGSADKDIPDEEPQRESARKPPGNPAI
jgi:hypothetical protein